jgi:hypothetical protein
LRFQSMKLIPREEQDIITELLENAKRGESPVH